MLHVTYRSKFLLELTSSAPDQSPSTEPNTQVHYLDPRLLAQQFYKGVETAIESMVNERMSFGNLVLHKSALQLQDKISTIHLMWDGEVFKNMMIYIDLAPAVRLPPEHQPTKCLPLVSTNQPRHVIAKKSRHNYGDDKEHNGFTYSYALQENEFIRKLPTNVRHGFMLAKALRIQSVCRVQNTHCLGLDRDEPIHIEAYIKTYMLKTCVMFLYDEHAQDGAVLSEDRYAWAERIYSRLEQHAFERKLPSYYGDGVLLQCGDHPLDSKV